MATATETCYRHPSRETGVACSNCGRPICPDCMTPTPVGMRCPECSKQKTQVRTVASIAGGPATVTMVLIAINVLAFLAEIGTNNSVDGAYARGALFGPLVADGEVWRIVTGGFLHARPPYGFIHIGFNMYLLYVLGRMLEPALGRVRFGLLYAVSLLAGSAGALLTSPDVPIVGASGAVFGLMGATFFTMRSRGIDPFQSGIGGLIAINLLLTFTLSNISIGGHVGGLIAGSVAFFVLEAADRRRVPIAGLIVLVVLAAASFGGAIAIANSAAG